MEPCCDIRISTFDGYLAQLSLVSHVLGGLRPIISDLPGSEEGLTTFSSDEAVPFHLLISLPTQDDTSAFDI